MSRALSTFDASEQRRFEAYRRSTFAGDAVATFVSHCLVNASEDRYTARTNACRLTNMGEREDKNLFGVRTTPRIENALKTRPSLIHRSTNCGGKTHTENGHHQLEQLVATDTASEITVVVSTLAKNYAQRLIQAARAVATAKGKSIQEAIDPKDLFEAHEHRSRAGLDPGFFVAASGSGPSSSIGGLASGSGPMSNRNCGGPSYGSGAIAAAALGIVDKNQLQLDAALAAQEQYDSLHSKGCTESSNGTKATECEDKEGGGSL